MEEVNQEVDSGVGVVMIGEKRWEVTWKKFRKYLEDERKKNMKKLQIELLRDVDDDECRWLECNVNAKKIRAIQRSRADGRNNQTNEQCRLCSKFNETA